MSLKKSLVMTLLGPDRPGLVEELAFVVATNGGNWLESRMAQLSGHFAGILRVRCSDQEADNLVRALNQIGCLAIHVEEEINLSVPESNPKRMQIDVVGNDRTGIVHQVASAIKKAGGNVEELDSNLESAPHAGHSVFRATGVVSIPELFDEAKLVEAIEAVGPDLSVSIGPKADE